jgi:hypothetical protein
MAASVVIPMVYHGVARCRGSDGNCPSQLNGNDRTDCSLNIRLRTHGLSLGVCDGHSIGGCDFEGLKARHGHRRLHVVLELHEGNTRASFHHPHFLEACASVIMFRLENSRYLITLLFDEEIAPPLSVLATLSSLLCTHTCPPPARTHTHTHTHTHTLLPDHATAKSMSHTYTRPTQAFGKSASHTM